MLSSMDMEHVIAGGTEELAAIERDWNAFDMGEVLRGRERAKR